VELSNRDNRQATLNFEQVLQACVNPPPRPKGGRLPAARLPAPPGLKARACGGNALDKLKLSSALAL
jgi:hypothetical protein